MNLKNTKACTADAEVIRKYSELCAEEFCKVEKPEDAEVFNGISESIYVDVKIKCPVDWSRGDECEYYYCESEEWRKGVYVTFDNHCHVVRDAEDNGYNGIDSDGNIRKPETEEQRNKRERLESAYDLYCTLNAGHSVVEFDRFKGTCRNWLRVVDKTNYRK